MELVHTFTKNLQTNPELLEKTLNVYKASVKVNSIFYDLKLYTDKCSYNSIKHFYENIEILDDFDSIFTDDLKFKVLPILNDNQLLIDYDIFLRRELTIDNNFDIICEIEILPYKNIEAYKYYIDIPNFFIKNNVNDAVPFFSNNLSNIPNIGVLKFNNKEAEEKYLNYYYSIKDWYVNNDISKKAENVYSDLKISAVVAQYLLGLFAKKFGYSIWYTHNVNSYSHFSGEYKYSDTFQNRINLRKKKTNSII